MTTLPARAAALIACAALLTGCTVGITTPGASVNLGPEAGQCLAEAIEYDNGIIDPDPESAVECTEPHLYQVVASIPVTGEFLTGATEEEMLQNREDLLTEGTLVRDLYVSWATDQCDLELARATGLGDVKLNGVDALTASLGPAGAFRADISLTEPMLWGSGNRSLICSVAWVDPADGITPRAISLVDGAGFAELFTDALPIQARQCLQYGDSELLPSSCEAPHYQEPVARFDASAVMGADWVAAVDPANATDEQYAELDAVCADVFEKTVGAASNPGVKVLGEFGSAGWNDGSDSSDYHEAFCALLAIDSMTFDVEGSLVGIGQGEPTLVAVDQ